MRPTSKIILGVFLSIFIISLLFIIGFSFSERRNYGFRTLNTIYIPQDNPIGIHLASHRVIVLEVDRTDEQTEIYPVFNSSGNSLVLNPITSGEENKLFIPEALNGFVAVKTNNDTLTIQIKSDEIRKEYDAEIWYNQLHFSGVNFNLYTSNANVVNKLNGLQTKVRNMVTDSIKIDSRGDILIESCKAIVIDPMMNQRNYRLTVKNSIAKIIYLDLDRLNDWKLEKCDIEIENLTGSGRHNITQHRNEKVKINWRPKNKNAELNIKVPGDTIQIVFQ